MIEKNFEEYKENHINNNRKKKEEEAKVSEIPESDEIRTD